MNIPSEPQVIMDFVNRNILPTASRLDWRSRSLLMGVVGIWVVLSIRLVQLQWYNSDELGQRAARQRSLFETIPPRPGEILDRHGRLLATTVKTNSLYLVPNRLENAWEVAQKLGNALNLNSDQLFEKLATHRQKQFLWIKRRLSSKEAERIRQLDLPSYLWGFRDEYQRRYPQGNLAAHVIGMRNIDGKGQGGIEQTLDSILGGQKGHRQLVRDAHGRVIDIRNEITQAPKHGRSVILTIDSIIQLFAERGLDKLMEKWKPKSASVVILDPKTGELLALASRPTFDPNNPQNVPEDAWKNHAIASFYEPGSTFKPFVVAWALEIEQLKLEEKFDCEQGEYRMGRRLLHDHHRYGVLNVTDILVKSSNIGMAKIGERITNTELFRAATTFGFGSKTGVELPGELKGIIRPLNQWNSYSTGSVPMGQEIAVTPIQLISAHAALANGGLFITPRLVLGTSDDLPTQNSYRKYDAVSISENKFQRSISPEVSSFARSKIVSQAVHPEIAQWLVEGPMTEVVSRGTGRRAQLKNYIVFGKTGTAQKLDPETGTYSKNRHVCSFICGAPADDPRVLVLVTVDEPTAGPHPYYGGTVAAPTAAEILHKTLLQLDIPSNTKPLRAARR